MELWPEQDTSPITTTETRDTRESVAASPPAHGREHLTAGTSVMMTSRMTMTVTA